MDFLKCHENEMSRNKEKGSGIKFELSPAIYHRLIRPKWINHMYIHNRIQKHLKLHDKNVLDFGAGTGANCNLCKPGKYVEIDPGGRIIAIEPCFSKKSKISNKVSWIKVIMDFFIKNEEGYFDYFKREGFQCETIQMFRKLFLYNELFFTAYYPKFITIISTLVLICKLRITYSNTKDTN
ncbi:hypothetical protein GCM10008986_07060 [Salinibacillus aidingensis]|uniref:Methyltransferase domain-containing protein n=1 Tax=Salinibacillus aidingensis TaxID=237684 RepID=A0ABP3KPC6_9BACI